LANERRSEWPIDAEPNITARLIFKIIAGEAARERDFDAAEISPHEAAGATGIVFLVAKRAAL
jgi:hypothetical protein